MSTRDALIQELMKQPEPVLQEVRHFLDSITAQREAGNASVVKSGSWPVRYFEHTAGAFANEPFERPAQLPFEKREEW